MESIEVGAKKPTSHDKLVKVIKLHKAVFGGEAGAALLEFLMADNHFVTGIFDENPQVMAFKEGQRSVIASILERVDIPMSVVRKMTEDVKDKFSDADEEDGAPKPQSYID